MLSLTRGRSSCGQKMFKKRLVSAPLLVIPQFKQELDAATSCNAVLLETVLPTWSQGEIQSAQQSDTTLSKAINWLNPILFLTFLMHTTQETSALDASIPGTWSTVRTTRLSSWRPLFKPLWRQPKLNIRAY